MSNIQLFHFCETGDLENVIRVLHFRSGDLGQLPSEALRIACKHGQAKIVEYFLQNLDIYENLKTVYKFAGALEEAVKNGHLHIIKLMSHIQCGWPPNNSYNTAMRNACVNGDINIINAVTQFALDQNGEISIDMYKYGLVGACEGNHIEIVKLMLENLGPHNQSEQVSLLWEYVYKTNNPEITALITHIYPVQWSSAFLGACRGGYLAIAQDIYTRFGPFDSDMYLKWLAVEYAAKNGDIEMHKFTTSLVNHRQFHCELYAACSDTRSNEIIDMIIENVSYYRDNMVDTIRLLFNEPILDIALTERIVHKFHESDKLLFYTRGFRFAIDSYNIPTIKILLLRGIGEVSDLLPGQLTLLVDAGIPLKFFTDRYEKLQQSARDEIVAMHVLYDERKVALMGATTFPEAIVCIIATYLAYLNW